MATSAADPTAMVPFCGKIPKSWAALAAVSATKVCRSIRPFDTPSEKTIGSRVSTPGTPFGILVNGTSVPPADLLDGPLKLYGAWSDEITSRTPVRGSYSRRGAIRLSGPRRHRHRASLWSTWPPEGRACPAIGRHRTPRATARQDD